MTLRICRFLKHPPKLFAQIVFVVLIVLMSQSYALGEPMNIRPNNPPPITGAPPGSFRASQDLSGLMTPLNEPGTILKIEPKKAPPGSFRAAQDLPPEARYLGKVGEQGELYLYRRSSETDVLNPDLERDQGGVTLKLKLPF